MSRSFVLPSQQPPATPPRYPSKPTPNKPPRRGFLGAAAALVVAPAVAKAAQTSAPDAALIAKCREVVAAHEACVASYCYPITATAAEAKPYEDRADYYCGLSFEAAAAAAQIPATTLTGLLAKAQAALALATKDRNDEIVVSDNAEWLAMECLEDLVRVAGGGS